MANVFAGRSGILAAGGVIGLSAALLQFAGNPANMFLAEQTESLTLAP